MRQVRLHVGGGWRDGASTYVKADTYTGELVADVHVPGPEQVDEALRALARAQAGSTLSPHDRAVMLMGASDQVRERHDELVDAIVTDTGFTTRDATIEADRAVRTLQLCGEEARRLAGHVVPLAGEPGGADRLAFTLRRPVGVVCAITPFNSPLNTVCHKVGPALAAGNAVVLKPAFETPLTAALLVHCLLDGGVPASLVALLPGDAAVGQLLLDHPVPAFYAFTGSTHVGKHIAASVGLRRTQLELGSLASTIVCADADLELAAGMCVDGAFRKAGQVCTSVQRLYVAREVADELGVLLERRLRDEVVGDPRAPGASVGPVITSASADRIESWVGEAVACGAELVRGGGRNGSVIEPTVLAGVDPGMKVMRREMFGPVVVLRPFDFFTDAVAEANDTPYGLAAGVFTDSLDIALAAAQSLRVGTVHVNATSSSRLDAMPFGGVKASGSGLEGPHYAVREMSEETLVTIGRSKR